MAGSFSATIDAWVAESQRRLEAVVKTAAQDVAEEITRPVGAGGRMKIDTGYLRASLLASTAAMPMIDRDSRPAEGGVYGDPNVSLVIAGAQMGEPIYLGFTASYAAHREYGARGQSPDGFVRGAADQWQRIVREAVSKVKGGR